MSLPDDLTQHGSRRNQTPTSMTRTPTVFLIESAAQHKDLLGRLGEAHDFSVEHFPTGESFFEAVDPSRAGCLVADMVLPDMHAGALQARLKALNITLPVIFMAFNTALRDVVNVMKQGAVDVLEKPFPFAQLSGVVLECIEQDAKHRNRMQNLQDTQRRLAELTDDERVVAEHLVSGKTNKEIAVALGAGLRTIQFRRSSLMKKLGVSSRGGLIELLAPLTKVVRQDRASDAS